VAALWNRAADRFELNPESTTADTDVARRDWLLIDLDPKRPANVSASDAEHDAALERTAEIRDYLYTLGFPEPVRGDSGNGGHLSYRIDLPNEPPITSLIRQVLEALAFKFSDRVVEVDLTTFNAARIWKLYGTTATKGDNTPERPHRRSHLLEVPEQLRIVSREALERLAALAPAAEPPHGNRGNRQQHGSFDVEKFIADHNIEIVRRGPWQGGERWIFAACPWNPEHTNQSAYIVRFAGGAIAAGCHRNRCAGKNWHDLRELYDPGYQDRHANPFAGKAQPDEPAANKSGRPAIYVNHGQLRERTRQAVAALLQRNDPPALFCRSELVRLRDETFELEALDTRGVLAELAEAADWIKSGEDGVAVSDPPDKVVQAILGARTLPFPLIDTVARAPFFTRSGQLVVQPGYYPEARVYLGLEPALASQLGSLSFPDQPAVEDVAWACAQLDDLFGDFPFADAASRTHAKALTLLPFVRPMIDGPTPNHAVNAPHRGEGTGKGLLIRTACVPGLGEVAASPETTDKEEMRKVLTAAVIEGAPIVWFDNVHSEIKSGPLAAILTAPDWVDRVLGKSRRFRGKVLTTWCVAGNALRFTREQQRRAIMIRIDANVPRPWERTGFAHQLPGWALKHRATLIRACVILVRNWIAHGQPAGTRTLGSFESWAHVIGGILESAGIEGFLDNRDEQATATDEEELTGRR
jgi:hypothetical protein